MAAHCAGATMSKMYKYDDVKLELGENILLYQMSSSTARACSVTVTGSNLTHLQLQGLSSVEVGLEKDRCSCSDTEVRPRVGAVQEHLGRVWMEEARRQMWEWTRQVGDEESKPVINGRGRGVMAQVGYCSQSCRAFFAGAWRC